MQRQETIKEVQNILPWASAAVSILGVILVYSGGKRMRRAQDWEDRGLRARTQQEEASIQPQTKQEREQRMIEDIAEEQPSMAKPIGRQPASDVVTATLKTAEPRHQGGQVALSAVEPVSTAIQPRRRVKRGSKGVQVQSLMSETMAINEEILAQVGKIKPNAYLLQEDIRVSRGESTLLLDGLLWSERQSFPDVIIEIKVYHGISSIWSRAADMVLGYLTRYRDLTGRSCIGWLIAVTDTEEVPPRQMSRLRASLESHGWVTLIRRQDIETLVFPGRMPHQSS